MDQEIYNLTINDGDLIKEIARTNVTYNFHDFFTDGEQIMLYISFFLQIARIIPSLIAIIADILYIFIILRFNLNKSYNRYILCFLICNLCYYVMSPLIYILHALILSGLFSSGTPYMFADSIEKMFYYGMFFYLFCMGLDWFLNTLYPSFVAKIEPVYKYKFYIYLPFMILDLCLYRKTCYSYYYCPYVRVRQVLILTMFALLLIFRYLRSRKVLDKHQLRTEYTSMVPVIFFAYYMPEFAIEEITSFEWVQSRYLIFSELLYDINDLFLVLAPVIVIVYVHRHSKHFRMAYEKMFKSAVKDYHNENMDAESEDEKENREQNDVQHSYLESVDVVPIVVP